MCSGCSLQPLSNIRTIGDKTVTATDDMYDSVVVMLANIKKINEKTATKVAIKYTGFDQHFINLKTHRTQVNCLKK